MKNKFVVDMTIFGRGDALALVDARTCHEARERVEKKVEQAQLAPVQIHSITPWDEFTIKDDLGLTLIPRC